MKRLVPILLLFTIHAVEAQTQMPFEFFKPETHPQWLKDLRRAEIVTFGSLPFTMFASSFIVDGVRFLSHGANTLYAPWPFKPAGAIDMNDTEKAITISAAVLSSIVIAIVDHIIVRHKRNQVESTKQDDDAVIIRTPLYWSP